MPTRDTAPIPPRLLRAFDQELHPPFHTPDDPEGAAVESDCRRRRGEASRLLSAVWPECDARTELFRIYKVPTEAAEQEQYGRDPGNEYRSLARRKPPRFCSVPQPEESHLRFLRFCAVRATGGGCDNTRRLQRLGQSPECALARCIVGKGNWQRASDCVVVLGQPTWRLPARGRGRSRCELDHWTAG